MRPTLAPDDRSTDITIDTMTEQALLPAMEHEAPLDSTTTSSDHPDNNDRSLRRNR
jgi:hypothetical protein